MIQDPSASIKDHKRERGGQRGTERQAQRETETKRRKRGNTLGRVTHTHHILKEKGEERERERERERMRGRKKRARKKKKREHTIVQSCGLFFGHLSIFIRYILKWSELNGGVLISNASMDCLRLEEVPCASSDGRAPGEFTSSTTFFVISRSFKTSELSTAAGGCILSIFIHHNALLQYSIDDRFLLVFHPFLYGLFLSNRILFLLK